MALPVQTQAKYWSISIAVFALALWYLGDVIMPFILGGAIAYFMDPIADRLETMGFSRVTATVVISVLALLLFVVAILLVVPTLVSQALALANAAPTLFHELQTFLTERFPSLMDENSTIRKSLETIGQRIQDRGGELVGTVLNSALGVINIVVLLVVTPVVAFYLLLDWDRMVAQIDRLLPLDHRAEIREIARNIDRTLASFHPWPRVGLHRFGHLLRRCADVGRSSIRTGCWLYRWPYHLYSLCGRTGWRRACHRTWAVPILG